MTTTANDWPLAPAGAVAIEGWEGEGKDRGRFFNHAPVDVGEAILTIRGVQYSNGTTGRSILLRLAEEIQSDGDDLTPRSARGLAAMLQNFADTCEILDDAVKR